MILGGCVGYEREVQEQSAGLRTNILVALGACMFSIISQTGFDPDRPTSDTARIAAQIVAGVGFLGAATVFRDRNRIRGLTTAAGIWLVAAVGMAIGAGQIFLGVVATALALITLVLQPLKAYLPNGKGDAQKIES